MSPVEPTLGDAGFAPEATDPVSRAWRAGSPRASTPIPRASTPGCSRRCGTGRASTPRSRRRSSVPTATPVRRPELDAFPQRMWVGGRVRVVQPLELDEEATRVSRVASAAMKEGAAGAFWLVTVDHTTSQRGDVRITEEQDLVFRGATALATPGPARDDPPEAEWVETLRQPRALAHRTCRAGRGGAHERDPVRSRRGHDARSDDLTSVPRPVAIT